MNLEYWFEISTWITKDNSLKYNEEVNGDKNAPFEEIVGLSLRS